MRGYRAAGTSSLKPILGVAILIIYHELLEEWATVVASKGEISPYISMWGIFAIFTMVSLSLYAGSIDQAARRKGCRARTKTDAASRWRNRASQQGAATRAAE